MKGWLVLLLLLVPTLAQAQGHPCDTNPGTTFTVNAGSVTVLPCWDEKDTSGAAVTAVQWGITIDSVRTPIAMTKVTPTANALGLFQFSGTAVLTKGIRSVLVDVCIDDGVGGTVCAAIASPLAVKAKGPGPKPPVNTAVRQP